MAASDLAYRAASQSSSHTTKDASPRTTSLQDPFTSSDSFASIPASNLTQQPSSLPQIPQPCAYIHHSPRRSQDAVPNARKDVSHARMQSSTAGDNLYGKMGSWSSGGSTVDGLASVDLEKGSLAKEYEEWRSSRASKTSRTSRQSRQSRRSRDQRDPEKAQRSRNSSGHARTHDNASQHVSEEDDADADINDGEQLQYQKAMSVLFFLSGPVVALSFVNLAWALIALVITTLSQPVRLCARRLGFGTQLASLLGPTLNLQLRAIYTPLPPHANEDGSYHTGWLILVHMLSPFISIGVALTMWVVAVYWLLAAIVGEPDPSVTEKRDDGRETCLALRKWWERWLVRSLVQQ